MASTGSRTSTSRRCCRRSRQRSPRGRVIVAHLGSGASLCALKNGRSVDSTLGFTALDGLCMGTRPGALDPGVVLYLFQTLGLSATQVETILYKKSGLLGISGISNDMRDLLGQRCAGGAPRRGLLRLPRREGDRRAGRRARRPRRASCSPPASARTRRRSAAASARRRRGSAVELDDEANQRRRPRISTAGSRVSAWVVPTNEELMIARHTGVCWAWSKPARSGPGPKEQLHGNSRDARRRR